MTLVKVLRFKAVPE